MLLLLFVHLIQFHVHQLHLLKCQQVDSIEPLENKQTKKKEHANVFFFTIKKINFKQKLKQTSCAMVCVSPVLLEKSI